METTPDKVAARLDGFMDGLKRAEPEKVVEQAAYESGYEEGRQAFAGLCGETIGQAMVMLETAAPLRDTFEADTRLLGYFGPLHRAAMRVCREMEGATEAQRTAITELADCTVLPPDIEAAVEGPRGRPQ